MTFTLSFFRCTVFSLTCLIVIGSSAHADDIDKAYERASKSYQDLVHSPQKKLFRHNWERVIDSFLSLVSTHDKHERTAFAAYMAAKTCHGLYLASGKQEDAQWALKSYSEVAHSYPDNSLADDSLYLAGTILEAVFNNPQGAAKYYSEILRAYPLGDRVDKAQLKLRALGKITASESNRETSLEEATYTVTGMDKHRKASVTPDSDAPYPGKENSLSFELTTDRSVSGINIPGAGLRCIVVDPGHGGKDPGAVGPGGVKEKEVALAIARSLAMRLRDRLGCKVLLSRDQDIYLTTEERAAFANRVDADLFISIHTNSASIKEAHGIETYSLNFSKNEQAAAVVARENETTLKEVGNLERILFDLMANSKIHESSRLAMEIQRNLVDRLNDHYDEVKNLGVRQGPFDVLLGATMPSVLIEVGFISNEKEEKRLNNSKYQELAVSGIAAGIVRYAQEHMLIAEK